MNITILWIGLLIVGILVVAIPLIIKMIKNKKRAKNTVVIKINQDLNINPTDVSHPQIQLKSEDHLLYKKFMIKYDTVNFEFENSSYRKGADITCEFGISAGYKIIEGKMKWGYVRLHTGVDRSGGNAYIFKNGDSIDDPIICPFDFNRTNFINYYDKGYGTLIQLFNDEYGFEMRIAHMNPQEDIIPWSLKRIKNGRSFEKGWVIGRSGSYGASSGRHSHTEFLSTDESCEVFEILLEEKYIEKALKEYSSAEVVRLYKKQENFKNSNTATILKDWRAVKNYRGALFANKYKYQFKRADNGLVFTRYSSNLLFNGL